MGTYSDRFKAIQEGMIAKVDAAKDGYIKATDARNITLADDAGAVKRRAHADMEAAEAAARSEARAAIRALFADVRGEVGRHLAAPPQPGQAEYLDALRAKSRITQTDIDAAAVALTGWPAAAGVLLDMIQERPGLKVPADMGTTGAGLLAQLDNACEREVQLCGRYRAGTPTDARFGNIGDALRATVGLECEAIKAAESFLGME